MIKKQIKDARKLAFQGEHANSIPLIREAARYVVNQMRKILQYGREHG